VPELGHAMMSAAAPIFVKWPQSDVVRDNWGDKLNPILVSLLSCRLVQPATEATCEPIYSVIGSHLKGVTRNHIVWGTGFIAENDKLSEKPMQICAVRGPLSHAMLHAQGVGCPEVYGDPAILYPIFYRPKLTKRYELGVIKHVRDRLIAPLPASLIGSEVKEIDITGDVRTVVNEICSCQYIASSSLHGIIAAHSYGIPASWIKFGDRVRGDGLKFRDYYASIGIFKPNEIFVKDDFTRRMLAEQCQLPETPINTTALIEACPFMDAARKAALIALAK
jgi:hypothetical protein